MSSRCLPITKAIRERRRKEAELRQAAYDTLSTQQKIDRLPPEPYSQKQRAKLLARLAEESNPKRTKVEIKATEPEAQPEGE
jgi:hypothetical protein